ncbi:MAG: hypothetical protein JWM73_1176 [Solirubrobacterales bacterium]|nr:hypothetical protein [Solirubrobacterales bacterium]
MTALPLVAEAVVAAVLVVSMVRAFFGRAPERADVVAAGAWMAAALMLLGTVLLSEGEALWRLAVTVAGVEAACVAGWWLRSAGDDGGARGEDEPGPDWDEFDRLRGGWSRGGRDRIRAG